jgi:uncharacterized protein (TIGR03083 family)
VLQLNSALDFLESAVSYALACVVMVTPEFLPCPTPCADWDLETLLDHLTDSIGVLNEALVTGGIGPGAAPGHHGPDHGDSGCPGPGGSCCQSSGHTVARLRAQAASLLTTCADAGSGERLVAIGDRELAASLVALTGAIEISAHGWDVARACDVRAPIPSALASTLLPLAPLLVTPDTRPMLFADPVWLPESAHPGDRLLAFLGRHP